MASVGCRAASRPRHGLWRGQGGKSGERRMASEKKTGAAKKRARKRGQSESGRAGSRAKEPHAAARRAAKRTTPLVAGIGASAGGLEAFTELLRHLPTDSGMARGLTTTAGCSPFPRPSSASTRQVAWWVRTGRRKPPARAP